MGVVRKQFCGMNPAASRMGSVGHDGRRRRGGRNMSVVYPIRPPRYVCGESGGHPRPPVPPLVRVLQPLGKRGRLRYNVNTGTKGFDRERRIWIAGRGAITLAKQVAKKQQANIRLPWPPN